MHGIIWHNLVISLLEKVCSPVFLKALAMLCCAAADVVLEFGLISVLDHDSVRAHRASQQTRGGTFFLDFPKRRMEEMNYVAAVLSTFQAPALCSVFAYWLGKSRSLLMVCRLEVRF